MSEATEELFRLYYRPLCLYALHYVSDAVIVEDIVQDSFLKLLEQPSDAVASKQAWLYRVVRNACLHHLREAARSSGTRLPIDQKEPDDSFFPATDIDGTPLSDSEAQRRSQQEAALWAAIDSLPPRCREVFLLAKRDGQRYSDIAQALGISEKTVEHQVAKALRLLRSSGSLKRLQFVFAFI